MHNSYRSDQHLRYRPMYPQVLEIRETDIRTVTIIHQTWVAWTMAGTKIKREGEARRLVTGSQKKGVAG